MVGWGGGGDNEGGGQGVARCEVMVVCEGERRVSARRAKILLSPLTVHIHFLPYIWYSINSKQQISELSHQ